MHRQTPSRRRRIIRKPSSQASDQQDGAEIPPQNLLKQGLVQIKAFAARFLPGLLFWTTDAPSDDENDRTAERQPPDIPSHALVKANTTLDQTRENSDVNTSATDSNMSSEASKDLPKLSGTLEGPRTCGPSSEELTERQQHDRDFAPFRAISVDRFKAQLRKYLDPSGEVFTNPRMRVLRRTEGASHHVVILQFGAPQYELDYVFKLPVTGTKERWKEEHAYTMNCEAMLIKHIKKHTDIPMPEIKQVDLGFENKLGAPYILMNRVRGKSAGYIWYEKGDGYAMNADSPPEETMKKRETFLKSLAGHMAQLRKLEFYKIGMPICDEGAPVVGHSWETVDGDRKMRPATGSTQNYLISGIEDRWPSDMTLEDIEGDDDEYKQKELDEMRGMRKIIDMIFRSPPFTDLEGGMERYVIRHPDLDLQNIMTDKDGNVTGIIDWHEAVTAPRCVGYAGLPRFLVKDWLPDFTLEDPPYMAWNLDHYRRMYANAMKESCEDGKFTYKSTMYQAVYAAVTRGGSARDLVNKVLLQLPRLRLVDLDEFQERLGRGWLAAESYLEKEIRELFDSTSA